MPGLSRTAAESSGFEARLPLAYWMKSEFLAAMAGRLTKSMNFSAASTLPASFGITKESNHMSAPSFGIE
ncbi:hypothetical protein D3C72_2431330 [compost metagenome]